MRKHGKLGAPALGLEDGESYVIAFPSKGESRIYRPNDAPPLKVIFPKLGGAEHVILPLHITRSWTEADHYTFSIGFWASAGGDAFPDSEYCFRVPKRTWKDGRWQCVKRVVGVPGFPLMIEESPERTTADAEGLDRDSIAVRSAIDAARRRADG